MVNIYDEILVMLQNSNFHEINVTILYVRTIQTGTLLNPISYITQQGISEAALQTGN